MPIYEFVCRDCGHYFEVLVRVEKEKDVCCPVCNKKEIQKLFSTFGIGGGSNRLSRSSSACTSCASKSCSTCY